MSDQDQQQGAAAGAAAGVSGQEIGRPALDAGAEKTGRVDLSTPDACLRAMEEASAAIWTGRLKASAGAAICKAAQQALSVHDSNNLARIADLERRLKGAEPVKRRRRRHDRSTTLSST